MHDHSKNHTFIAKEDRIFLGEGLFETLRVENFEPCYAQLHWNRISKAAKHLGIPFHLRAKEWYQVLKDQIQLGDLQNGGIKVILSGGSAPRGLAQQGQLSQLMFQTFNYSKRTEPLHLVSSQWLRDAANPIYQLKTVNYLEAIIARKQAITLGADDVLFFNTQHHATETTCANVFIIRQDALFTPPLQDGVLPGITRSMLKKRCLENVIPFFEESITKPLINQAQMMFATNSLQGMVCIKKLDELDFALEHVLFDQLTRLLASN